MFVYVSLCLCLFVFICLFVCVYSSVLVSILTVMCLRKREGHIEMCICMFNVRFFCVYICVFVSFRVRVYVCAFVRLCVNLCLCVCVFVLLSMGIRKREIVKGKERILVNFVCKVLPMCLFVHVCVFDVDQHLYQLTD